MSYMSSTLSGENGNRKDAREARTALGSIGRSAASPLTATAALRFAPYRFPGKSIRRPVGAFRGRGRFGASRLHAPFSGAAQADPLAR